MIEVFKTNVTNAEEAQFILNKIHAAFPGYKANFDLDDCDRILRVKSAIGPICAATLIHLLSTMEVFAEVLADDHVLRDN